MIIERFKDGADLVDFEVIPVITSKEAAERMAKEQMRGMSRTQGQA